MTTTGREIIDLGVLDQDAPAPRGLVLPPRTRQRLANAIVALVCLLGLGASAIGEPGLNHPLWTATVGAVGFDLGSDAVLVFREGGDEVIARDLRTGEQLWRFDVAGKLNFAMDLGGGLTMVSTLPPGAQNGISTNTVHILRTLTGERIGQIEKVADVILAMPGRPALVRTAPDGCGAIDCLALMGWDLATNTSAWRVDLPPGSTMDLSVGIDAVNALVTATPGGLVESRDVASGKVLTSARLPEVAAGANVTLWREAVVTTSRVVDGRTTIKAYQRPSLTPIWSIDLPAPSSGGWQSTTVWLSGCGEDVCVHVPNGGVRVIDLDTGTVTAQTDLSVLARVGDGVFLASGPGQKTDVFGQAEVANLVLDPSLRVLGDLHVTTQFWSDRLDHALFLREDHARTTFVDVDQDGRQALLGSTAGTELICRSQGRYLACADPSGLLRVWRLPSHWPGV